MKIIRAHIQKIIAGTLLVQGIARGAIGDGLLNYWNFDNDNANDTAGIYPTATSASDDHGTINGVGVTFVDGQAPGFGRAASFTGVAGDNITVPDPTAGTDDIDRSGADVTISVWFQAASWTTGWQAILAHGEGQDYRMAREASGNNIAVVAGVTDIKTSNSAVVGVPGSFVSGDGTWHHAVVAATNGGFASFYMNGVLVNTSEGLADPTVSIGPSGANNNLLCIGCNPDNGREFNGLIDDIAMWDRELSALEIEEIYNAGAAGQDLKALLDTDDDDGDGLPNSWEDAKLGPGAKDDDGTVNPDFGAAGDPDMDSSTNIDEFNNGTEPNDDDTDDDGLLDGYETNTDVYNSATDTGTDPLNDDSDGDGLLDGLEDNSGTYDPGDVDGKTGTNPNLLDSDSDTMPDGYEVDNQQDPTVDDSALDPDADDLSNLVEFGLGTDPQDDDSDDDFSKDGEENTIGTNPLVSDTDGDTILDGYETNTGTYEDDEDTGTDPLNADTDGDGTHDGAEFLAGRNPFVADGLTSGLGQKLVAYWTFDNTLEDIAHILPGESIVADDGTYTGLEADPIYSAEGFLGSSSLVLDGVSGHVLVPSSVDTLRGAENAVSVSAWFKVPAFSTNWQALVAHGEGNQWRLARRNNENTMAWAGGAGDIPGAGIGPIIADGAWHHVAATSNPDGFTEIWLDGVLIETGAAPNISDTVNGVIPDLLIGANPNTNPARTWVGEIDDLAVWGRALTSDEIGIIYNGGEGESIENLLGGGALPVISEITYDPEGGAGNNGEVSLTFNSRLNVTYAIYGSYNLSDAFPIIIDEAVVGGDGSTTVTFNNPDPAVSTLFFRIEQPRP